MTKTFNSIGVAGAGTMGAGIAQVLAVAGYKTVLYDVSHTMLDGMVERLMEKVERAIAKEKLPPDAIINLKHNLTTTPNVHELGEGQDLIIEAVPEKLELKQELFTKLDTICPEDTCFVSNTSSLSITVLAGTTKRPDRVAGLHFFNPVPVMKLVEVIKGRQTPVDLMNRLCEFSISIGKTPVRVKDTHGFIVNRVARSFYGEAFRLLNEGVASPDTIDAIMKGEGGFRMGPFELMDLIGIDINYAVTQSVYEAYFHEGRFQPHPIQRDMVASGYLGRKSNQGFYDYADPSAQ